VRQRRRGQEAEGDGTKLRDVSNTCLATAAVLELAPGVTEGNTLICLGVMCFRNFSVHGRIILK
jgi:hypothetical protein